jgi:hypothetical protein
MAVNDTDVRRDGFVDVDWVVKRGAHIAEPSYPGAANVGTNAPFHLGGQTETNPV